MCIWTIVCLKNSYYWRLFTTVVVMCNGLLLKIYKRQRLFLIQTNKKKSLLHPSVSSVLGTHSHPRPQMQSLVSGSSSLKVIRSTLLENQPSTRCRRNSSPFRRQILSSSSEEISKEHSSIEKAVWNPFVGLTFGAFTLGDLFLANSFVTNAPFLLGRGRRSYLPGKGTSAFSILQLRLDFY